MQATDRFVSYEEKDLLEGVYMPDHEKSFYTHEWELNHEISLVGWGEKVL
jgi:hypothetical protein